QRGRVPAAPTRRASTSGSAAKSPTMARRSRYSARSRTGDGLRRRLGARDRPSRRRGIAAADSSPAITGMAAPLREGQTALQLCGGRVPPPRLRSVSVALGRFALLSPAGFGLGGGKRRRLSPAYPARLDSNRGKERSVAQGKVKWFNGQKGYGFITTDEGEDVFVHYSAIGGSGFRTLEQGQRVQFEVTQGPK